MNIKQVELRRPSCLYPTTDDLASTCKFILLDLAKKSTCKGLQVPTRLTCQILQLIIKCFISDVTAFSVKYTLIGHKVQLNGLRFLSASNYLPSESADNTVRLWDTTSGSFVCSFSSFYELIKAFDFF